MDQFEELFTLCKDEGTGGLRHRHCWPPAVNRTSAAPPLCTVILTVHADFYAQCLGFEKLRAAFETHQKPIGAMNHAELQRTIELPAQAGKWAFQQGLVEQILDDVGDEPGKLPLLSYALLETWKRRSGRVMTLAGYQAAGGVDKAISRTADRVFDDLAQQGLGDVARRILFSLVDPGEGAAPPAAGSSGCSRPGGGRFAERPSAAGPVRTRSPLGHRGGETVQISHEALITAWPKLGEWLRTYRDDLQLLKGIRDAAEAWGAARRPKNTTCWPTAAAGWTMRSSCTTRRVPLANPAPAYLDACVALRDRERGRAQTATRPPPADRGRGGDRAGPGAAGRGGCRLGME